MLTGVLPAAMSKVPPSMGDALLRRAEWSLCAMEHSLIGPVCLEDPGMPFHHLALPLGNAPPKVYMKIEGRRSNGGIARDTIGVIEAGVGGIVSWDKPYESACFYFTSESLAVALGRDVNSYAHSIRTTGILHAPVICHLLHALHADAATGQPHGALIGDSIFVALAARLVPAGEHRRSCRRPGTHDWRIRRALEHIHAHLTDALNITSIAAAAATSPFHLSRSFREMLGCSIWQYVLRERARRALILMRDPALNLADVAQSAGFETYSGFIEAVRREFGQAPAKLRQATRRS